MSEYLWPVKQTKKKAYYELDGKKAVVTRKGKYHFEQTGDKMKDVTLLQMMDETVHDDRLTLTYKKK